MHCFLSQVQSQLFCTGRGYCDFIVWTEQEIHIERILPDESFWLQCVNKAHHFFQTACLPELLGKWFSRSPKVECKEIDSDADQVATLNDVYCYCRGPEEGPMVACDNSSCPYQWFHFKCLGLKTEPLTKSWFCPSCRTANKGKKRKTSTIAP